MTENKNDGLWSRREFVVLTGLATAGTIAGCATNPVTGKNQLMLMSEKDEIQLDKANAPHQFSADYGAIQDKMLNDYVTDVGKRIAAVSHRPNMPFSFRCVNATYANAYAFPGGSIAATRGILLELDDEAQLAGLLGHEAGHVCARHTADRMTKTMLAQAVVVGLTAYAAYENEKYAPIAAGLGGIGAGALLAKYSRDDERQADALGLEYMTKAGLNPMGMVGLMNILRGMSQSKPNMIERMFASHPMSDARYKTALEAAQGKYKDKQGLPYNKESYMDHTANLRKIKGAINQIQNGESELLDQKYPAAEQHFKQALKEAPHDYVGLIMMSKCLLAQKKNGEALRYAEEAKQAYPQEPQANHLSGMAKMDLKKFNAALADFNAYEKKLPGNPFTTFYKGFAFEGMQNRNKAIEQYKKYLDVVNSGEQAEYAYKRLVEWGVIKEQSQQQGSK
ncbi:M48 family metalloprotease [bacterium]|nr:M48 family metalloprotease [bacterium]